MLNGSRRVTSAVFVAAIVCGCNQVAVSPQATSSSGSGAPGITNGSGSTGSGGGTGGNTSSSITLAWNAPTENTDGTALTDLAGYNLHYGTTSQSYTGIISINNPLATQYVVSTLPPGNYYFAISAYDSAGSESSLSNEVSGTIH